MQIGVLVNLVDQRSFQQRDAQTQPRGVPEKVADGHLAFWFHQVVDCAVPILQHFHAAQFRNVTRHRVVQLEASLFPQHHRGDAGDRLGHRCNAENGVRLHWHAGFAAQLPKPLEINCLFFPRNQRYDAGQLFLVNVALESVVYPQQTFGGHADILWTADLSDQISHWRRPWLLLALAG